MSEIHEAPGARIGRYRLVEVLGEGGFGAVWLAEQEEPVKRQVALKLLKLGMDSKQVVARFEAERQALARMDHPHIAKVLDGGLTDSGRPYFVMELVHGVSITKFCDEAKLGTEARLELFTLVCRAVQHAHQKGVIHRDLKPSNVLVAMNDGEPAPKVIDFGIAKATAGSLTERTLVTELRQFIGTPEYMAPEQAEISGLDIDTRADVYSLGVLLYELLTGAKPFDLRTVAMRGYDEILRHIREIEPAKPSTRVSTLDDAAEIAARRGRGKFELGRELRGDLDWIVMKALEKDRERRYDTADALADDVQRHLDDEPVLASPPSTLYRLVKFARRNRLAVGAGAVVLVALVIGLAVAGAGLVEAREQLARALKAEAEQERLYDEAKTARDEAVAQSTRAQASEASARSEAQKSQQVARIMTEMLESVGPAVARGRDTELLAEILGAAGPRIQSELAGEPLVQADLLSTIGNVYRELGRYAESIELHQRVLALRREHADDDSTARALNDLAIVQVHANDFDGAVASMREGVELLGERGDVATRLTFKANFAATLLRRGDFAEAEDLLRDVAEQQRAAGNDFDAAYTFGNLAAALHSRGQYEQAAEVQRETIEIVQSALGSDHPEAVTAEGNLVPMLRATGQLDEAREVALRVIAAQRELLGDSHPNLAKALNNLGSVEFERGDLDAAFAHFESCVAMIREHSGDDGADLAHPLSWMSSIATARGDLERAEALARESLRVTELNFGAQHAESAVRLDDLAHIVQRTDRQDEALELSRRAFERLLASENSWGAQSDHAGCYPKLAAAQGHWNDAEKALMRLWQRVSGVARLAAVERTIAAQIVDFYTAWNAADPSPARVREAGRWSEVLARLPPDK